MSAVNANTVMETRDVNQMLLNTLKTSYKEMLQDVIRVICNHYNLDHDDVKEYVDSKIDGVNLVKKEKVTKPKAPKFDFPIPFCGEVNENLCKGIKFNRGLFTQCPKKPGTGTHYCATCKKSADSVENKKPVYGDIRDRAKMGLTEFKDNKGRYAKTWATVLKSMGKSLDDCKKQVERELGIEIPEEHLVVIEKSKGRPAKSEKESKKKSKKSMDDDMANALDESDSESELEKVGVKVNQPKKSKKDEDSKKSEKKSKKVNRIKFKKSDMKKILYKEQTFYLAEDGNVYDMDMEKPEHVGTYDEDSDRIIGNNKYASHFIYDEPNESGSEEDEDEENRTVRYLG